MINLIRKELIVTRIYQIVGAILIFVLGPTLLLSINDIAAYSMFIFINLMIVILICNTEMILEIMKKPDLIIMSLPVRRDNIVKGKYIFYGLYTFLSSIILYLVATFSYKNSFIGELSKAIGNLENGIGPDVLFFSLVICLIYISISMPLYYLLGDKSKIIGYILLISLFIIPDIDEILGIFKNIVDFPIGIVLCITFAIYLASMKISIKIYNKKEF